MTICRISGKTYYRIDANRLQHTSRIRLFTFKILQCTPQHLCESHVLQSQRIYPHSNFIFYNFFFYMSCDWLSEIVSHYLRTNIKNKQTNEFVVCEQVLCFSYLDNRPAYIHTYKYIIPMCVCAVLKYLFFIYVVLWSQIHECVNEK